MTQGPSIADHVPLWCTLEHLGVTALVTPAGEYVGAVEVTPLDPLHLSDDAAEALGRGLDSLVRQLPDGTTLHCLYDVGVSDKSDSAAYAALSPGAPRALRQHVERRAAWMAARPLKKVKVYLFFSTGALLAPHTGLLGIRLLFPLGKQPTEAAQDKQLSTLRDLRDSLVNTLQGLGLRTRELTRDEVRAIHYRLLNPERTAQDPKRLPRAMPAAPPAGIPWCTEADQLTFEPIVDEGRHLEQGALLRRVMTLKTLPQDETNVVQLEELLKLGEDDSAGVRQPVPFLLAVTVRVRHQGLSNTVLVHRHKLVESVKSGLPFLGATSRNIASEEGERLAQQDLQGLVSELKTTHRKLTDLSVSILLEAHSLGHLNRLSGLARAAFTRSGASELYDEPLTQIPAFLSMFPGAGSYQLRKRACTSANAADFLPFFATDTGSTKPMSLFETPHGGPFTLNILDGGTNHHGTIFAPAGSGKSVLAMAAVTDALARGCDAILIDDGCSWQRATEVFGGIHIPISTQTPLTPFLPYEKMLKPDSLEFDGDEILAVVRFLEVCLTDPNQAGAAHFEQEVLDLVTRAVRHLYEGLRARPQHRPVMSDIRDAILSYADGGEQEGLAEIIARKLALFCGDGQFAGMLDRPSDLRFDAQLLTFELGRVTDPLARKIALATVMRSIEVQAASRRKGVHKHTLVFIDEAHKILGQDLAAARFIATCFATLRKYAIWMWIITQVYATIRNSPYCSEIRENAPNRIFLLHSSGRDEIIEDFKFSERAAKAFEALERKDGYFSDALIQTSTGKVSAFRIALDPVAYWMLTTTDADKKLLERARALNPKLSPTALLEGMAKSLPHGAQAA